MATQRMTVGGKTMFRDGASERMSTDKPSTKKKGSDGKVCWEGYRYGGTVNGRDVCNKMKK
jgi:hypothetical protein